MGNFWDDAVTLYHGFSISLGGLVFGYYSGIIIGLLFIQEDFQSLITEAMWNTGFLGGVSGVVFASWANDSLGRKLSMLIADVLMVFGGVVIILQHFLLGKILLSIGVGLISSTSPLYISEISSHKLRDRLICTNSCLFFAIGKLLAFYLGYYVNLPEPAKTNFMISVACIPAPFQFILILTSVPESPAWLYIMDRKRDAVGALRIIYSNEGGDSVKKVNALKLSFEDKNSTPNEKRMHCSISMSPSTKALSSPSVQTQLAYGVSLHVFQQFVGFNALMYCIPFITTMWGVEGLIIPIHDHVTCRKFTLLNLYGPYNIFAAICSVCSHRACGRKNLSNSAISRLLYLVCGLSFIFMVAPTNNMSRSETTTRFWDNNTSSSYNLKPFAESGAAWHYSLPQEQVLPPGAVSWDCLACMKTLTGPLPWFRADKRDIKFPQDYSQPCPRDVYWLCAVLILCSYIFWWTVRLETMPWTVNSEIYPTQVKGLCGAMATMANWISFLIVSLVFFSLIRFLGPLSALIVLCAFTYYGEKFVNSFVVKTSSI